MTDMKKKLAKLYQDDPDQFRALITEFSKRGARIFDGILSHPRHRKDTRNRHMPSANAWIWARVQFLVWRDGGSTREACARLAHFQAQRQFPAVTVPQTDNYRHHPGREPTPGVIEIRADEPDAVRKRFYKYRDEADKSTGEMLLEFMKDSHTGFWEKALPGWKPLDLSQQVPPPCGDSLGD